MRTTEQNKVVNLSGLLNLVKKWRHKGETIVFTNGVFDLLHRGHLLSFQKAAEFGDRLVVAINSDVSVKKLGKGSERPFCNENDRASLIAGFSVVDLVLVFDEPTPYELLSKIKPDVLVKGSDYSPEEIIGREFAGRVECIELLNGYSTTNLIEKIRKYFNNV